MALINGKQLRDETVSLDKLSGTGVVSFTDSATMSFLDGAKLQIATVPTEAHDVVNLEYLSGSYSELSEAIEEAIQNNTTFATRGLVKEGLTFSIDEAAAGDGLTFSEGGVFDILVNSDALEISGDEVKLKDSISGFRTFEDGLEVQSGLTVSSGNVNISENLVVEGNFRVNGTTTFVNTTELEVTDNIITLAKGNTAGSGVDAGFKVDRGTDPQARLIWDESLDLWTAGLTGSEKAILTDVGFGLTQNGMTVSLDSSVAGDGLTFSEGVLKVEVENGLTNEGDKIVLGGTISQTTSLSMESGLGFEISAGSEGTFFAIGDGYVTIEGKDSVEILSDEVFLEALQFNVEIDGTFSVDSTSIDFIFGTFSANSYDGKGIVYAGDYKSTFVTHSLVDKDYVDTELGQVQASVTTGAVGLGLTFSNDKFDVLVDSAALEIDGDNEVSLKSSISGFRTFEDGLDVQSGLTVSTGDVSIANKLDVDGGVDVANGLTVSSGDVSIANKLDVDGGADIAGGLTVSSGNVNISENLVVEGNFRVNGTTTFVNTTELEVTDNIITLAKGNTAGSGVDAGFKVDRGTDPQARLIWDESLDLWTAGLTGSEKAILTDVGFGLTQNGMTVSLDSSVAGDGLSFTDGVVEVNTGLGLTISGDNVDMIWGGTATGLTISESTGVAVVTDGTTIKVNSSGELEVIGGSAKPVYVVENPTATGATTSTGIALPSEPNDFSRVQVFVNGLLVNLGDGDTSKDAYFMNGVVKTLQGLEDTNVLHWTGVAGYELDEQDVVQIVYETQA